MRLSTKHRRDIRSKFNALAGFFPAVPAVAKFIRESFCEENSSYANLPSLDTRMLNVPLNAFQIRLFHFRHLLRPRKWFV